MGSARRRDLAQSALAAAAFGGLVAAPATLSHASGDRAFGQYLSSECVACHQVSGRFDGIPPIVGWPENSFVEIMNEYKTKKREHAVMQTIAGRLSPEEIAALAAYFGSIAPAPAPTQREGGRS
jgi:cytochrome c553